MSRRITLAFEHPAFLHPTCNVDVDVHLPLPDPITEGAGAMADRCRPFCPICKEPMWFVGHSFSDDEDDGDDTSTAENPR